MDSTAPPSSWYGDLSKFPWMIDIRHYNHPGCKATPQLMGGVHPSTKIHVGNRLAQAVSPTLSPLLSCQVLTSQQTSLKSSLSRRVCLPRAF